MLVTGAGGLLGHCACRLLGSGWSIIGFNRDQLDITDGDQVRRQISSIRPQVVINCAAATDVDRCELEPEWAFAINASGPALLAEACSEVGAELVHISTDYVFDGTKYDFYTQEDEPNPLSVYAKSKLAGEIAVLDQMSRSPRYFIIRSSWIFGPGGKNFASRVLELARAGRPIRAVFDQVSIPTYAPDLVRRISDIIERGVYGLYHVTNTGPTTWHEFARAALELAGLRAQIEPVSRDSLGWAAPRPKNSPMKCLLSERLGFQPLRHWREALAEFIRLQATQRESS
jgi:dTDP-4-dehydrorhamnose reductase